MNFSVHQLCPQAPSHDPMDLAYCAGLFDGDGCITISRQHLAGRKHPTYRLALSLVQNCINTVSHFQSRLAQPACLVKVKRTSQHNRQVWDLRFDGRHALHVLALLEPYLVRKRIEAQVAAQFWATCQMGVLPGMRGLSAQIWEDRERFYKKLRRLK